MILTFDLPTPSNLKGKVVWTGSNFVCDKEQFSVLEYSENFAGWSDDLTALHEELVGNSHPIDIASRRDAIRQIFLLNPVLDSVIMEIGCSSGFLLKEITKIAPKAILIGADVVKIPLYKLAHSLPNVPLIRFDLLKNPLPKSSIDILVMLNVLEHIEDDVTALKNAFELLKPGGSLVIEVPAGPYLYDNYDAELRHFRRYTALELQAKLESVGFTIMRKSHLGFFLFPAFAVIKLINKFRGGDSNQVVKTQATRSSASKFVSLLMRLESKISQFISFPFGIRVLITAKKG
jgi:SAM-dependent methyltransferase